MTYISKIKNWLDTRFANIFRYFRNCLIKNKRSLNDDISLEDFFERDIFAEEISCKITSEHGTTNSSYIFGISGRWGEGKTHLLLLLKKKLEESGFTVVLFSPWKYAQDKSALMRCFIKSINQKLPALFPPWRRRVNLLDFERDQDIFSLNLLWCGILSISIAVTFYILHYIPWVKNNLQTYKDLAILIIIPLVVGIFSKLGTFQKTTRVVSAIDQFDERLDIILKKINKYKKKIVVFVDDLDRVSGKEAKIVLDALRTFFDKKDLSYVVTGDHQILEGQIEKELINQPGNQDEDGRRFLKKIFNVYWRLPIPTKNQMQSFISSRIAKISLSDSEKEKLTEWLLKFFDYNPRNIERFLEMLEFNVLSLERRKTSLEGNQDEIENLGQITEVLSNKLLLARALMLQDRAYPLYEKIVIEPNLLRSIEERVDRQQDYAEIVQNLRIVLKDSQVQFLAEYLPEEPRFYTNNGLAHRILPFFKLASEVGLSDDRGISLDGFENFLRVNNYQAISQWLKLTKDVQSLASRTQQIIEGEGDLNQKKAFIQTIIQSITEDTDIARVFLGTIIPTVDSSLKALDSVSRVEVINQIIPITDRMRADDAQQIIAQISFTQPEDFNNLSQNLGKSSINILARWMITYMAQDFWAGLNQFVSKKNQFNESDRGIFQQQEDAVTANFFGGNDEQRSQCLEFLEFTPDGLDKVRNLMLTNYDSMSQDERDRLVKMIIARYGNRSWRSPRAVKWIREGN